MTTENLSHEQIAIQVRQWLETLVIGLNLCPFAKRELVKNRVRFAVTEADDEEQLLEVLTEELKRLEITPDIETTLLIHPRVLTDFFDYTRFLLRADRLLGQLKLRGQFQIASFHPHYEFAYGATDDLGNYTNRSPYPILHLLREDSLEQVIANFSDTATIPQRNVELLERLGREHIEKLVQSCLKVDGADKS